MQVIEDSKWRLINPKAYLAHEIKTESCKHLVVSANGFDDYDFTCTCLIYGAKVHYNRQKSPNDQYINYTFGFLTPNKESTLIDMISLICERYKDEEGIDIVLLLNKLKSRLENINSSLNNGNKAKIKKAIEKSFK